MVLSEVDTPIYSMSIDWLAMRASRRGWPDNFGSAVPEG